MGVSKEGLLSRDKLVYETIVSKKLPFVMTLGGGYGLDSWEIHYQFLREILRNKLNT